MSVFRQLRYAILCIAAASSASPSCGPQAGGGIGGTGAVSSVSSGPITKFGSIYVSGTRYDNADTLYCIDDEPCSQENTLKVGMVVIAYGVVTPPSPTQQDATRIANTIFFEETVEGVVQSVAKDGSNLVVLGQRIAVDKDTVIDASIPGQTMSNLIPGIDVVEISGLVAGDGHIVATLIMKQSGTPHYEIQGAVKNHDVQAKRFEIGQLIVDYSAADVSHLSALTSRTWDGKIVHVRGDHWTALATADGAELHATRVRQLGLGVEDSTEAKLQGFITQTGQAGEFTINNHFIRVRSSTTFEGGTLENLTLGDHVHVHGELVDQVLQADHIVFK
jgi:hypothetical protein